MGLPFFGRALAQGRKIMNPVQSLSVSYVPLDGTAFSIKAVPGLETTDVLTDQGLTVTRSNRDFMVELDQLTSLGRHPKRGDKIVVDGTSFKVLHPGGGREWDWHTTYEDAYRIHTQAVD